MIQEVVMLNIVCFYCVLCVLFECVYCVFFEVDVMVKWLLLNGFIGKVYYFDVCVDGSYRMLFINFVIGESYVFGGIYIELVFYECICYIDCFDDLILLGEIVVIIILKLVVCGMEL